MYEIIQILLEAFIEKVSDESTSKLLRILLNLIIWIGLGILLIYAATTFKPEEDNYIVDVIVMSVLAGVFFTTWLADIMKIIIYTFVLDDNKKNKK